MGLFKNEKFDIGKSTINSSSRLYSDQEINEKYLKGEIRIVTEQARYPLNSITALLSSGNYELNPEYQRRKRWSIEQQSRLIESFIINVPIPPIFLYEVDFANYEVMDGLQRLTAINEFYEDKYALQGLEEWKELNGRKYSQLPLKVREGIDRRYISSIVLLKETASTQEIANFLKLIVFGRLNSGGDKLTPQENRNALYGGVFNDLCIELSKNDDFRNLWGFPLYEIGDNGQLLNEIDLLESDEYRKMADVELVLRFFAYRHIATAPAINQENFLDQYLIEANKYSFELLAELKTHFEKVVYLAYEIFGKEAFYMPTKTRETITPTKTIYDPLMQAISNLVDREDDLIEHKDELRTQKYKDEEKLLLPKDKNNQMFDGKYNSYSTVRERIKYFTEYITAIIES